MKKLSLMFITCSLLVTNAHAASLADALEACSQTENSLKRLVCYDRLAKDLRQFSDSDYTPAPKATGQVQTRTVTAAPRASAPAATSATDNFGLEHKNLNHEVEKLYANITSVKKDGFDKLTITLDNGQVWKQLDDDRLRVHSGDRVYIERGVMNSFLMGQDAYDRQMRVRRLK